MIEQQGRVTAASDARVRVRMGGTSGCSACDAGRGCGAGIFGRLLQRRPVELEFENHIGAGIGQAVMVGLPESIFLRLVLRLYLLPLLSGLAGAVAGHYLSGRAGLSGAVVDLGALLAGVGLAWLVISRNKNRPAEFTQDSAVHLLRILNPGISNPTESCDTR
jgi:sigma-E factor negative regulatory protein RseC